MLVNGQPSAAISIQDRGLLYGDGVFRTMRVVDQKIKYWSQHYAKLRSDCQRLKIPCPPQSLLQQQFAQLQLSAQAAVLKLIVTRGQGTRGYAMPESSRPGIIWDSSPEPAKRLQYQQQGVALAVAECRLADQPLLAGIKHLNRLENVLAASELQVLNQSRGRYQEILLTDHQSAVIEGSRSNVFMVKGRQLLTPDLSRCGVAGVIRDLVMQQAADLGVSVQTGRFSLADCLQADEIFLTNSIAGVYPVRSLQQCSWSSFPFTRQLQNIIND